MKCPKCGTENQSGFKFCVKCGLSLAEAKEITIEQISQQGFHSENEPASKGFTIGKGTFVVNDRPKYESSSQLFTADELNNSDEMFDFSNYDEPFIPKLDAERVSLPKQIRTPHPDPCANNMYGRQPLMGGMPQMNVSKPNMGAVPQMNVSKPNMGAVPQMNVSKPNMGAVPQMNVSKPNMGAVPQMNVSKPNMGAVPQMNVSKPNMGAVPQMNTLKPNMGTVPQMNVSKPNMGAVPQMNTLKPNMGAVPQMNTLKPNMGAVPQMNVSKPNMGTVPQMNISKPNMGAVPQMGGVQNPPQILGYDQNGSPIYGQPAVRSQAQFIGYDQNGNPVYGQPVVYNQPQFIGYDQNGTPVYGQPVVYSQPQIIGYDSRSGLPIYGQTAAIPVGNAPMQKAPLPSETEKSAEEEKRVDVPDDFWEFFDGGKATKHKDASNNDFFGKHSGDMDDVSAQSVDLSRLKRFERKRNDYMGDVAVADASSLKPNDVDKFNKLYMKKTEVISADKLEYNEKKKTKDRMRVTGEVDAHSLVKNKEAEKWDIMGDTGNASADKLEAYVPQHTQSIMAQAEHAVNALPEKKKTYNDIIDAIEIPEYMKARKTVKTETIEIPALPELHDLYSQK